MIAVQGDPYIGPVDGGPTSESQLSEVYGGDIVSIMLVATAYTSEQCLTSSIPSINSSTAGASLRSIFRFNIDNWNSFFQTLVLNHLLQLSESPTVEGSVVASVVALPTLVFSNPVKLLHHDKISSNNQRVDESSADLMQNCVDPAMLPPAKPFKPPLCRGGAFSLEGAPKLPKMSPPMLDWFTIDAKTVGSHQELVNPDVNPYGVLSRRFWSFNRYSDMQVEFVTIPSVNQFGIPHMIFEQLSLITSDGKLWLNPSFDCANRSFKLSIPEKSEQPFIQIHRELSKLMLLLPIHFVRLSNSISRPYRKTCRKPKSFTGFIVNKVMQCNGIVNSVIPCHLTNIVAGISKCFNCIHQFSEFFLSCFKFAYHCLVAFHQNLYMPSRFKNLTEVRKAAPPIAEVSCRQGL